MIGIHLPQRKIKVRKSKFNRVTYSFDVLIFYIQSCIFAYKQKHLFVIHFLNKNNKIKSNQILTLNFKFRKKKIILLV